MNCELTIIENVTYVKIADDTATGTDGSTWFRHAHAPLIETVRIAQARMDAAVAAGLTGLDNATAYMEALEVRNAAEEDIEILTTLWTY